MSITISSKARVGGRLATLAFLGVFLSACATTPPPPEGSVEVRNKLSALQADPNLNERARVEVREAEKAVSLAEQPVSNDQASIGEHRVYMAERMVGIAEAKASTQYAESQRAGLSEKRAAARLDARTLEADRAQIEAEQAKANALRERNAAEQANSESARKAAELQQRIANLEAEATERGLVLTLGDVLFATGSAELRGGTNSKLNKVVTFLNQYPKRKAIIEGHTDNVGQASFNQDLSQRRADAVRSYLTQQGVASNRLSSTGMGMGSPVSSNDDSTGRQQNRRVEIVIENTPDA